MNLGPDSSRQFFTTTWEESIFDMESFFREPLNEEIVKFCIYNEFGPKEKKTKQEEEWDLRMTCVQEWFIRCSSINKFLFIEKLLHSSSGLFVLENVMKCTDTILSKDFLESLSHEPVIYDYDRVPADDNRALDDDELSGVMKEDFTWFVNLNCSSQLRVILRLLRLGGGGFIFMVHKLAEKIFTERQKNEEYLHVLREEDSPDPNSGKSFQEVLELDNIEEKTEINESIREFITRKQTMYNQREEELAKYKKLRGIMEEDTKTTKEGEGVDYLQILPISLNRRIMSYIDEKTLQGFKKVGKYWSKMIDESISERSGRKAMNAKINKIVGIKADKDGRKREESTKEEDLKPVKELGVKALIAVKNENEKALNMMYKYYKLIFSRKCSTKMLDSSFHPERCGAFDGRVKILACSSPSNLVHFYSVKTGARFDFLLFGLESPVTCLTFHDNKTDIFVGCRDGTLISKDYKTNKTTAKFNGHTNAVLSICTTSTNFLSASEDNTVKYFRLWSGLCLLCIDLNPELHVLSALLRNDSSNLAAIGTREGVMVLVNLENNEFVTKIKLHNDGILQLAHDGDLLITGSSRGKIRVWNMNRLGDNTKILQPFFNINMDSPVTSLKLYHNQILCGCGNGTVKIIPLLSGRISKSLKVSFQTAIRGVDVIDDRPYVKLMIWHENGVEVRHYSVNKTSSKKSNERDRWKIRHRTSKESDSLFTSDSASDDYMTSFFDGFESIMNAQKKTTSNNPKLPIESRCCTISTLRSRQPKIWQFRTDVFAEAYNAGPERTESTMMTTFPRNLNVELE